MTIEQNPLKQYFRRPAIYLKLPSEGKYYEPGVVDIPEAGEIPVYPMTAIDEITSKTPDALYNGSAMSEIIKSCIPAIKKPWEINSIDLDAVLIAIKTASGGNELEISSNCPKCNETSDYGISLINLLSQLKAPNYGEELSIGDLSIRFRPLIYKEMNEASLGQIEAQRMFIVIDNEANEDIKAKKMQDAIKALTDTTMKILSHTIVYIKTPSAYVDDREYILDFLRNCDKDTYIAIRDFNAKLKEQTEIKPLNIKCVSCSHEYEQPFTLNTSDFFG